LVSPAIAGARAEEEASTAAAALIVGVGVVESILVVVVVDDDDVDVVVGVFAFAVVNSCCDNIKPATVAGAPSRKACRVLSKAFCVPMLYHNLDLEFCLRKRPGGTRSRTVETINFENCSFCGLGQRI